MVVQLVPVWAYRRYGRRCSHSSACSLVLSGSVGGRRDVLCLSALLVVLKRILGDGAVGPWVVCLSLCL